MVIRVLGRLDLVQAFIKRRRPLIGLAADKTVELVKPGSGRPAVGGPGEADFPGGGLVRLAECGGGEAVQAKHLGQRSHAVGGWPGLTREGGRGLGDRSHVAHMMIPTAQKSGAGRRAECRGMKVIVSEPALGQGFNRRHVNRSAEGTRLAEAHIIDEHDQHVGGARGCLHLESRWGFRIPHIELGDRWTTWLGNGEDRPVERVLGRLLGWPSTIPAEMVRQGQPAQRSTHSRAWPILDKTAALRTKASCRREFARLKEMTRNNLPPGGRNLPVAGFRKDLNRCRRALPGSDFLRAGLARIVASHRAGAYHAVLSSSERPWIDPTMLQVAGIALVVSILFSAAAIVSFSRSTAAARWLMICANGAAILGVLELVLTHELNGVAECSVPVRVRGLWVGRGRGAQARPAESALGPPIRDLRGIRGDVRRHGHSRPVAHSGAASGKLAAAVFIGVYIGAPSACFWPRR